MRDKLLTVFDKHSRQSLGFIREVNREGLVLLCVQPLPLKQSRDVVIKLPDEQVYLQAEIAFQLDTRWVKSVEEAGFQYVMGCTFAQITPSDLRLLLSVVNAEQAGAGKKARRHLLFYLDVIDKESGQVIGQLGDISQTGLMLLTEQRFLPDQVMEIRIKLLEDEAFSKRYIDVEIQTRWIRPDVNPAWWCVGCLFTQLAREDVPLIQQVQEILGFDEQVY